MAAFSALLHMAVLWPCGNASVASVAAWRSVVALVPLPHTRQAACERQDHSHAFTRSLTRVIQLRFLIRCPHYRRPPPCTRSLTGDRPTLTNTSLIPAHPLTSCSLTHSLPSTHPPTHSNHNLASMVNRCSTLRGSRPRPTERSKQDSSFARRTAPSVTTTGGAGWRIQRRTRTVAAAATCTRQQTASRSGPC
jgi:hypothetical protein